MDGDLSTGTPGGLSPATLDVLRTVLASHERVRRAVLYGSRAKGTFKPGSDIDLTLIGSDLTCDDLLDIADAFEELPIPYTVDVSLFDRIDNPSLRDHIQRVGIPFYQRAETSQTPQRGGLPAAS